MARQTPKRKCKHCQAFFVPDPRCAKRQRYCSTPPCRQASKAASHHRWLQKPDNRDYFTGPTHVERVRAWRQAHPAYWRRQAAEAPPALQEACTPQPSSKQSVDSNGKLPVLQEDFFRQPAVFVGLIAHLTGLSFQDDIALTARRLQQLGRDMLSGAPLDIGDQQDAQTPHLCPQAP